MDKVRFRLTHRQMALVLHVLELSLADKVRGEMLSLMWSILKGMDIKFQRRIVERRANYQMNLLTHEAIALRRILLTGEELSSFSHELHELRAILRELDPKLAHLLIN